MQSTTATSATASSSRARRPLYERPRNVAIWPVLGLKRLAVVLHNAPAAELGAPQDMARPKRRSSQSKFPRDPARKVVLLAATPLLLGGALALTVALAGADSPLGKWLKSFIGGTGGGGGTRTRAIRERLIAYARGEQPFAALREAIAGRAKGPVKTVFGPPRTRSEERRVGREGRDRWRE